MNPQERAVQKIHGPCLVMAGAGTGKTYTMVKKIAHLISSGIPSEHILCLTFSNEATESLKQKVGEEIGQNNVTIHTFHSFSADILREFGQHLGIDPGFDILLPDDAKVLLYREGITPYYADLYISTISTAKDFQIHLHQIKEHLGTFDLGPDPHSTARNLRREINTLHTQPQSTVKERRRIKARKKEINTFLKQFKEYTKYAGLIQAWELYERIKRERNVLDYSDLNYHVLRLFQEYGADELTTRFSHIIVDEFQDTNKQQFSLLQHIAAHGNITAVGDPNQSIYGFRGSYKESFAHFMEAFHATKEDIFRLTKSYRSTNTILRIAHRLIRNNYENPSDCFPVESVHNIEGDPSCVLACLNQDEEARLVVDIVRREIESGTPLPEICVLYRTHAQGKLLRRALEEANIPIITAGRTDLLQKPEIRTTIAHLAILSNLMSHSATGDQAWWDLFHYQNSLTPKDSILLSDYLHATRKRIDEALLSSLDNIGLSLTGKAIVNRVITRLTELRDSASKPFPDIILDIYELTGLSKAFTHDRTLRSLEGSQNLSQFYHLAFNYYTNHNTSLPSFIDYLEVLDKLGVVVDTSYIPQIDAVRVMTMHASKGLEFKTVIVTNMAEKRFPIERTLRKPLIPDNLNPDIQRHLLNTQPDDIDAAIKQYETASILYEERRLCYVALTRAKKKLIMTYALSYNSRDTSQSQFLTEVDFDNTPDIIFIRDNNSLAQFVQPSEYDTLLTSLRRQLITSLDTDSYTDLLQRLTTYCAVRDSTIPEKPDWDNIIDHADLNTRIRMQKDRRSQLKFDKNNFTFSPTALLTYADCPKRFELQHIRRMPERGAFEVRSATIGSFIHLILEGGINQSFSSEQQFIDHAHSLAQLPEWQGIDLADVEDLIHVFWIRNKDRSAIKTEVEKRLVANLGGFKFSGRADRIDFITETDIEIIDYKTSSYPIPPQNRAWQLGFYAIAAQQAGFNPVRLTLEMLRMEKPFVATIEDGTVKAPRVQPFTLEEIRQQLIDTANHIVADYEAEFWPTDSDQSCQHCGYKFYCPKWSLD